MAFTPFLQQVAANLWQRYGEQLGKLTIVLPTRRACLYFAEYLSELISKPVWQPSYKTLDGLMAESGSMAIADQYRLLVELYKVYIKHRKVQESFDHFYFWGEAMLNDFNTIDKYRVNARQLFRNLADQKELEGDYSFLDEAQVSLIQSFWQSFNPGESTAIQKSFVEIWDILYMVYTDFKQALKTKNIAYEGMSERWLADALTDETYEGDFNGTYVFVGLNVLNECEKTLLRHLKKQGKALFYWDYDKYYVDNENQEAGIFIRQNIREFPPEELPDDFSSFLTPKSIELVASAGDVMQAKLVPQLLEELPSSSKKTKERTAIIPADEKLLLPILYALPEGESVNVTMGYPFNQTPVFTLADLLIQLQRNGKVTSRGKATFYFKDVLAVLQHPYIRQMAGSKGLEVTDSIVKNNRIRVGKELFSGTFLTFIFRIVADYVAFTDYLIELFSRIAEFELDDDAALRREYVFHFISILRKLKLAVNEEEMEIGMTVYLSLLRLNIRKIHIPFIGEPLQGTQVMGVLESRALDFENVIILSMNEGVYPKAITSASFIPYNLRRGFGLPTIEQHEATYAYHFYRLLQRAKNIRLLYSTKADSSGSVEPSRYLYQLKMESGHKPVERALTYSVVIDKPREFSIEKNTELLGKIDKRAQQGFSPSAISTYVACPLQFYFKYILDLKETDDIEEDIGMASFGNILHRSVEKIYTPYIGKTLDKPTLIQLDRQADLLKQHVDEAFADTYYRLPKLPDDFEQNGRLSIVRDTILRYVRGILRYDAAKAPFTLKMLEEEVNVLHTVEVNGSKKEVALKGIIDRLDEVNGSIHIVDYKTGRSKHEFKGVEALFDESSDKQNSAVLQTFLYALMYDKKSGSQNTIIPTLYFIRDMHSDSFNPGIKERLPKAGLREVTDFSYYKDEYVKLLNNTLAGMFDSSKPFTQTPDVQVCKTRCPFSAICNR